MKWVANIILCSHDWGPKVIILTARLATGVTGQFKNKLEVNAMCVFSLQGRCWTQAITQNSELLCSFHDSEAWNAHSASEEGADDGFASVSLLGHASIISNLVPLSGFCCLLPWAGDKGMDSRAPNIRLCKQRTERAGWKRKGTDDDRRSEKALPLVTKL